MEIVHENREVVLVDNGSDEIIVHLKHSDVCLRITPHKNNNEICLTYEQSRIIPSSVNGLSAIRVLGKESDRNDSYIKHLKNQLLNEKQQNAPYESEEYYNNNQDMRSY